MVSIKVRESLAAAKNFHKQGLYSQAIEAYLCIPEEHKTIQILIDLASCYQKLENYKNAINILKQIDDWGNNQDVLRKIAECLKKVAEHFIHDGDDLAAIEAYLSIASQHKNKTMLLSLSLCYQRLNDHENELNTLYQIPDWKNDPKVFLQIAKCYLNLKEYRSSIFCLSLISHWKDNELALDCLASCYEKLGEFDNAIKMLKYIPDWYKKSGVLVRINRYYSYAARKNMGRGQYGKAITNFNHIPNQYKSNQAWLDIIHCYEKLGNDPLALMGYRQLFKKQDREMLYERGHYYERLGRYVDALDIYRSIPVENYHQQLILNMAHCYEKIGKPNEAEMMYGIIPVRDEGAQNTKTFASLSPTINLPPLIGSFLSSLSNGSDKAFLVGSTLLTLLNKQPLDKKQPIDIVVISPNEDDFKAPGFSRSPHNSHLFTTTVDEFLVNCYTAQAAHKSFLYYNALERDFNVASLFCDSGGNILDPTCLGLRDFYHKILQTVKGNPLKEFQEDPIRLLRATKYIVLGYKPTSNVTKSIVNWVPIDVLDLPHLYAVARKHLATLNPVQYVKQLQDTELLQKLFGIMPAANIHDTYLALTRLIGMRIDNIEIGIKTNRKNTPMKVSDISFSRQYSFSLFPRQVEAEAENFLKFKKEVKNLEALDLAAGPLTIPPHYPLPLARTARR